MLHNGRSTLQTYNFLPFLWLCSTALQFSWRILLPSGWDWAAHPSMEHTGGCGPHWWCFACKEHLALKQTNKQKSGMFCHLTSFSRFECCFPIPHKKNVVSASFNKSGRSKSQCTHLKGDDAKSFLKKLTTVINKKKTTYWWTGLILEGIISQECLQVSL